MDTVMQAFSFRRRADFAAAYFPLPTMFHLDVTPKMVESRELFM